MNSRLTPTLQIQDSNVDVRLGLLPRGSIESSWNGEFKGISGSGMNPFISCGGTQRGHLARSLPNQFDLPIPEQTGKLSRLSMVGVFAAFADERSEPSGSYGAAIQVLMNGRAKFRYNLIKGISYSDARQLNEVSESFGDGGSIKTIGQVELFGKQHRLDLLSIDIPNTELDTIRFKDLGTSASFAIYDAFLEFEKPRMCPFKEAASGIPLSEIGAIVRLGDRIRFEQALNQLAASIDQATDLDEARGQALTFLSVITAATLELGGPRSMVRVGLEASRCLDRMKSGEDIKSAILEILNSVAEPLMAENPYVNDRLIRKAVGIIDRQFTKPISDQSLARELGVSASHFRYLFRQAVGKPFHQYLIGLRLERANEMLMKTTLSVSEISSAVGFSGLSHFSRSFQQRFKLSPTEVRRLGSRRTD